MPRHWPLNKIIKGHICWSKLFLPFFEDWLQAVVRDETVATDRAFPDLLLTMMITFNFYCWQWCICSLLYPFFHSKAPSLLYLLLFAANKIILLFTLGFFSLRIKIVARFPFLTYCWSNAAGMHWWLMGSLRQKCSLKTKKRVTICLTPSNIFAWDLKVRLFHLRYCLPTCAPPPELSSSLLSPPDSIPVITDVRKHNEVMTPFTNWGETLICNYPSSPHSSAHSFLFTLLCA